MKKNLRKKFFIPLFILIIYNVSGYSQTVNFGKSYVNLTKGLNGGTIEPGDTLELRSVFVVSSGTLDSCGYFDAVPAGTAYIPGTIRILTNEGKIYKQFTDNHYDDEGWISGSNIRINLGYRQASNPARWFRRGRLANTHKPNFSNACIMIASFRVVVTAPLGTVINTGGGYMTYKSGSSSIQRFTFPTNYLAVYTNIGMCPNMVGANSIGTEYNGTFGTGKERNRVASPNVPPSYTYNVFNTATPNDYAYGIANNTSTRVNYSTSNGWAKPDASSPTHRVFGLWDILGDHTGAADPFLGNPAADTVNNNNGGYMLIVNASYRIDSAFQQTISGLCPNTYYEISCWVRNICSKCGTDSNGIGAHSGNTAYIPTEVGPPGQADSSGVYPNITFEVDGVDYYTTGNLKYTGRWVKKGFTFRTGPTQTSFNLKFFNNAPGGGGNDWALDDISVATCYPNLTVNPVPLYMACADNIVNFGATVRSFFNNYTQYKWQRSTDAGLTWNDTGESGTGIPAPVNGQYEYDVQYPTFIATSADSGHRYRLVVATTIPNLNDPNCSSSSESDYTTLSIITCQVLPFELKSWSASGKGSHAELRWITEKENEPVIFSVERSSDGLHFTEAGQMMGRYREGSENIYSFTDPEELSGGTWYRLRMTNADGKTGYSKIIRLYSSIPGFSVTTRDNPFRDRINLELQIPHDAEVTLKLTDAAGRIVSTGKSGMKKGINTYTIYEKDNLANGVYLLHVSFGNERKIIKLVKQ